MMMALPGPRRRLAAVIRARQELQRRWERLWPAPQRRPGATLAQCRATRTAADELGVGPIGMGRPWVATGAAPHPDAARIVADADALLRGEWSVFGRPFSVPPEGPDWRAHPLSGVRSSLRHHSRVPFVGAHVGGDAKFTWELNRHQELVRLAQAFALTGDERYAEYAIAQLSRWIEANPVGLGINWISALDVAFRAIAWCWVRRLTAHSRAWTDDRLDQLLWTANEAARFIARNDSIHHSPNTHLTGEGLGLLVVGSALPELPEAARWRRLGIDILTSEVPHQFLADGMHYERSSGYHRYHVEFYLLATLIARSTGATWDQPWRAPLLAALDVVAAMRRPDGTWPVLGDEDGGTTLRLGTLPIEDQSSLLAVGAALYPDAPWQSIVHPGARAVRWWFGLSDNEGSEVPRSTVTTRVTPLESAGYFMAGDQSGQWVLVDAGPHGGRSTGHAHTDLGHVEVCVGGVPIVTDPGCPVYTSDLARRDWYRSLAAHASLSIDRNPLAAPTHAFGWRTVAPTPVVRQGATAWGWQLQLQYRLPGDDAVTHERIVALVANRGVVVFDFVEGTGEHTLEWHWPLTEPSDSAGLSDRCVELHTRHARMSWSTSASATAEVRPSTRSPSYAVEVPSSMLMVSSPAAPVPAAGAFVVTPLSAPQPGIVLASAAEVTVIFPETGDQPAVRIQLQAARGVVALPVHPQGT
jgi:hypothetical protein